MQFSPSFQIVQLMREGMNAQEACDSVIKRMLRQSARQFEVAVIGLDTKVSWTRSTMFKVILSSLHFILLCMWYSVNACFLICQGTRKVPLSTTKQPLPITTLNCRFCKF